MIAHGMSNAEITRRLVLSEATVKTHVARVIMKTGCRDRAQAVAPWPTRADWSRPPRPPASGPLTTAARGSRVSP